MSEKVLGIDLGTSNSAACVFIDDKATMIPSAEGNSLYGKAFPSYVAFTEDGTQLVGSPAKEQAVENPDNTISEIKRRMGTNYKVTIQGNEYTPQAISAMILQKIKRDAESYLGEPITKAVITVPANFDDNQRTATMDAGEIADLEVLHIINEPTAASLAYGIDKQQEENINILIFDLGGGTLDITIMKVGNNKFHVQSTCGNTSLGGTDMDNVLIKYLADEFEKKHGIDLTQDTDTHRRLREEAEQAKIRLSNLPETNAKLQFIAMSNDGTPLNLDEKITRSKLEELVRPIVEKCGESIEEAIQSADLTIDEIDKVILVGGPTRMPIVKDYVENYTGKTVEGGIDPMECVSQGACIYAEIYENGLGSTDTDIIDVTPLSLGTVVVGGITEVMIEAQTDIPFEHTETFTTVRDNQTEVLCEVVQGENKMADLNTPLGSFVLDGIQPAPRGIPQIDVTFEINENGILEVTATDKATGNTESIKISSVNKMTDEEKEEAKRNARNMEAENIRRRKLAEARNEADSQIYSAQNLLNDSNITNQVDPSILERIETLVSELIDLKATDDERSIRQKIDELKVTVEEINSLI